MAERPVTVVLRLTSGIMTRRVIIPASLLRCFRVPLKTGGSLSALIEQMMNGGVFNNPVLRFGWDGKSVEGSDHVPILDLEGTE